MNIYFLTRSYWPPLVGGTLVRKTQVDLLKKHGFNVTVVTPHYGEKKIYTNRDVIKIPWNRNYRLSYLLQRIGFYEDYLDAWVATSFVYLKTIVTKHDTIFATSGGELGCVKLGSLLKQNTGCKFVVNFHDFIDQTLINGIKLTNEFHISREKQEEKYLRNADLIIPVSDSVQASLQNKYPHLKEKIKRNFFGYISKVTLKPKIHSSKLRVAYGGSFSFLQTPELLARIAQGIDGLEIYFIGDYKNYAPFAPFVENHHCIDFLPRKQFLDFMMEHIDVGFVSLANEACGDGLPSKVYEYINLCVPILGALPTDNHIINKNGYGIVCRYDNFPCLRRAIEKLKDTNQLHRFKENIMRDRDSWAMEERIKEVIVWLKNI